MHHRDDHTIGPLTRIAAAFGGLGMAVMGVGFGGLFVVALRDVIRGGPAEWNTLLLAPVLVVGAGMFAHNLLTAAWRGVNPPWEDDPSVERRY